MDNLSSLRDHLIALLRGGQAYETFDEIVNGFPPGLRGVVPPGAEHSAWQIIEHMRLTQRDILDFSRNDNGAYVEPRWPEDYWPAATAPAGSGWDTTRDGFLADRAALEALLRDPQKDLFAPFPWGDGQTLLREALLAADHASYHLGQIVILREVLAPGGETAPGP